MYLFTFAKEKKFLLVLIVVVSFDIKFTVSGVKKGQSTDCPPLLNMFRSYHTWAQQYIALHKGGGGGGGGSLSTNEYKQLCTQVYKLYTS